MSNPIETPNYGPPPVFPPLEQQAPVPPPEQQTPERQTLAEQTPQQRPNLTGTGEIEHTVTLLNQDPEQVSANPISSTEQVSAAQKEKVKETSNKTSKFIKDNWKGLSTLGGLTLLATGITFLAVGAVVCPPLVIAGSVIGYIAFPTLFPAHMAYIGEGEKGAENFQKGLVNDLNDGKTAEEILKKYNQAQLPDLRLQVNNDSPLHQLYNHNHTKTELTKLEKALKNPETKGAQFKLILDKLSENTKNRILLAIKEKAAAKDDHDAYICPMTDENRNAIKNQSKLTPEFLEQILQFRTDTPDTPSSIDFSDTLETIITNNQTDIDGAFKQLQDDVQKDFGKGMKTKEIAEKHFIAHKFTD